MGKFYFGDDMELLGVGDIGSLTFNDNLTDCMTNINIPLSDKAELNFECEVNHSLFQQMVGEVDLSSHSDATGYTLTGVMPKQVQVRYHKKKRINKKWIKRYGYKTVYKKVQMTEVHFDPLYTIDKEGDIRFLECSFVGKLFK